MATIYQTNKKTGITYVIESESYWDKEKQQPRSHRTILGKIDPDTGEIVPTKKYKREKKSSSPSDSQRASTHTTATAGMDLDASERIAELERQISELRAEKEALLCDLNNVLQQHKG